jgi:hypothetical protein
VYDRLTWLSAVGLAPLIVLTIAVVLACKDEQDGTTSHGYVTEVTVVLDVDRRSSGWLTRADGRCDTSCACRE